MSEQPPMTPTAKIAAIRQRYVSRSQVRRLTVIDAGRVHDDICAIVAAWDARESALRALVAQWRAMAERQREDAEYGRAIVSDGCADQLERLLESEQ